MESECFPRKLRYDISMSKRTRKSPLIVKEEAVKSPQHPQELINSVENIEDVNEEREEKAEKGVISNNDEEEEEDQKKSLKQLIEGRGTSLGHHFTEEERQLEMVVKQPENGLKFKQMVSRYAKFLGHMIKIKRKKPAGYRLKMQVHNKP
ncbi:uncharacterized protein LOC132610255 [Lycium barbarum]|uniref:uncharacterized protein LOC132610255 n=1 Tax=Lycium barbarum TaxID=112863 RepID=UPI00293EC22A|nr:uncharacterized protein LOC132610255 [Lycium barbarum]